MKISMVSNCVKPINNTLMSDNKKVNIIDCMFILSLLWFNDGVIRIIPYFAAMANLVIVCVGIISIFPRDDKFLNRLTPYGYWYGAFFLLSISFTFVAIFLAMDFEIWNVLYALIIVIIYVYFSTQNREKQKNVAKILIIDQIIINVVSYIKILQSPMLARIYATGNTDEIFSKTSSTFLLGTFGHIYVSIFIVLFLILKLKGSKTDTFEKILYWCYIVTSVILIYKASFTIAILSIMVFGVCTLFVSKKSRTGEIFKIVVILIVILCILPYLIRFMLEKIFYDNYEVSVRLEEVLEFLSGNMSSKSDISSRVYLYKKSLKRFWEYPIFGVWDMSGSSLLGNHAEWIDGIARFGILRYPLFIAFLVKVLRKIHSERKYPNGMFIVYLAFILVGLVNPIIFQQTFLAFFIILPFTTDEKNEKAEIVD